MRKERKRKMQNKNGKRLTREKKQRNTHASKYAKIMESVKTIDK